MDRTGIALGGNIILDNYKEIETYPSHSTLTTIQNVHQETGGLTLNCAFSLSQIDPSLPLFLIGRMGQDEAGQTILKKLARFPNINLDHVAMNGSTSFTDAMIDITHKTRTYFQFRGANADLCEQDFGLEQLNARFLHVGYLLLLDTLDQPDEAYGTRMARLLHHAQQKGIKTSIDVVSESSDRFRRIVPPALRYVDYAILNEYEGSMTTGITVRNEKGHYLPDQALKICHQLADMGVSTWVILHSREGAIGLSKTGEQVVLPSLKIDDDKIVSTIGAGDAFLSGCLYGAYQNLSLSESMKMGIAAASTSLMQFNSTDGVLSAEKLLEFYEKTPKDTLFLEL